MPEIRALLVYGARHGIQVCGAAPAELATTPHATRLAALSDVAEEFMPDSPPECTNCYTALVSGTDFDEIQTTVQ